MGLLELGRHPEIQQQIREEVIEAYEKSGDDPSFCYDNLPYLSSFLKVNSPSHSGIFRSTAVITDRKYSGCIHNFLCRNGSQRKTLSCLYPSRSSTLGARESRKFQFPKVSISQYALRP